MSKKATTKEPFLPLFMGDFLGATAEWDGEERALYLLLLGYQWTGGSLPADPRKLRKLVDYDQENFERWWPQVSGKFQPSENGRLLNVRLEAHRAKTKELSDKNSNAGAKGASSKWGENRPDHGATRAQRLAEARKRGTHTDAEWAVLVHICGPDCRRCGAPDVPKFVKDHIVPLYQGGSDGIDNLQPLCKRCSCEKGPETTDFRPDDWRERLANALESSGESLRMPDDGQTTNVSERQANARHHEPITPGNPSDPIRSDPIPSYPIRDASVVTPTDAADSTERGESAPIGSQQQPGMTPAGAMAIALRRARVRVTSIDPVLHDWIREGYTIERMLEAVEVAKLSKPNEIIPANYLDRVVRNMANKIQPTLATRPAETPRQRELRILRDEGAGEGFRPPRENEQPEQYRTALKAFQRQQADKAAKRMQDMAVGIDVAAATKAMPK